MLSSALCVEYSHESAIRVGNTNGIGGGAFVEHVLGGDGAEMGWCAAAAICNGT
jgi:hypothetical protein